MQANGIWSVRRGKNSTINMYPPPPPRCARLLRCLPMRPRFLHRPAYTFRDLITSTMESAPIHIPGSPRYHVVALSPASSTRHHLLRHRHPRATQQTHHLAIHSIISLITTPAKISGSPTRSLTRPLRALTRLAQALSSSKHCNKSSVELLLALLLLCFSYFVIRTFIMVMFI